MFLARAFFFVILPCSVFSAEKENDAPFVLTVEEMVIKGWFDINKGGNPFIQVRYNDIMLPAKPYQKSRREPLSEIRKRLGINLVKNEASDSSQATTPPTPKLSEDLHCYEKMVDCEEEKRPDTVSCGYCGTILLIDRVLSEGAPEFHQHRLVCSQKR